MPQQETWTIKKMLDWTTGYLERKGEERPRLSAEWLVSAVTGLSRVELYTNFDRPLSPDELARMHDAVVRRGQGEPLQYVTGEMPFRHIVLTCEEGVLIPRPETEVLVDAALEGVDRAAATHPAHVLEVGVGTGCISCSIAAERPGTHVVATDLSPKAAGLARRNAQKIGVADFVTVVECDLVSGVDPALLGTFDVLVSNPPYIPSDVVPTLPQEVAGFEPHLALDGGADGLDIFRRLLDAAPKLLRPGGLMCMELFEGNVHAAADLCRQQGGWARVEVREDLTHRPRVLYAVREGDLADGGQMVRFQDPKVMRAEQNAPSRSVVDRMVKVLLGGGVVVMPTDSVYGIGCIAYPGNPGHGRIFDIKHRDRAQTLPWLIADARDLGRFGVGVPEWAHALAREFWPGALTLVVRAADIVPPEYVLAPSGDSAAEAADPAMAGRGTIALRVPDSELVRQAIRACGIPLATTSANTHGAPSATSGSSVEQALLDGADLVIDAGPAPVAVASTIVDCTGEAPKVLREGAIPTADIMRVATSVR